MGHRAASGCPRCPIDGRSRAVAESLATHSNGGPMSRQAQFGGRRGADNLSGTSDVPRSGDHFLATSILQQPVYVPRWDIDPSSRHRSAHSLPILPACVPASLRPCVPASLRPCVPASLRPCVPASLRPCVPASLRPCVRASPVPRALARLAARPWGRCPIAGRLAGVMGHRPRLKQLSPTATRPARTTRPAGTIRGLEPPRARTSAG
jgi:hypothetical protein